MTPANITQLMHARWWKRSSIIVAWWTSLAVDHVTPLRFSPLYS